MLEFCRRFRRDYGPNSRLVYFDCQRHAECCRSVQEFFERLIEEIRLAEPGASNRNRSHVVEKTAGIDCGLGLLLERLDAAGVVTIVFFDEFDKAVASGELISGGTFGILRSLGQHLPRFAWVTSTHRYLHALFEESFAANAVSPIRQRSESDFFNIAPTQVVGLFSVKEAQDLVCEPGVRVGIPFTENEQAAILRFGGRFPYFLQRAAFKMFAAKERGDDQCFDLLEASTREATPLWNGYLTKLSQSSREILNLVVNEKPVSASTEMELLRDMSLVYPDSKSNSYRPFSESCGCFVRADSMTSADLSGNRGLLDKTISVRSVSRWGTYLGLLIVGAAMIPCSSWLAGYIQWKTGWSGYWNDLRLLIRGAAAMDFVAISALLARKRTDWEFSGRAAIVACLVLFGVYVLGDRTVPIASAAGFAVLVGTAAVTLIQPKK
jgi:hypothetical protein